MSNVFVYRIILLCLTCPAVVMSQPYQTPSHPSMSNSFLVFFCFAGKTTQVLSNFLDNKLREDLERLKKIRAHRGLRHYWGVRVRGQHTKTTGRRGRTVGVSKKK